MKIAVRVAVALAVTVGSMSLAAGFAPIANAASGPIYSVMNTSETLPDGVYFRNSPNWNDTNRTSGLGVFKNERVQLECYAFGQAIGPYSDRLWYFVLNLSRPVNDGVTNQGMLDAHYINDGKAANVVDAGVPACVNNRPPAPVPAPKYDRNSAVAWAKGNAEDAQPFSAACTWFVSNALWEGGLPKTATWTNSGPGYGALPVNHRPGTPTANAVPLLANYLVSQGLVVKVPLNLNQNAVPQAQLGDLIVYSWDGGKTWDHIAIVVNISSGSYPDVAEWGSNNNLVTPLGGHPRSPYVERGWTWSQLKHEWLETKYKGQVSAFLLHITY